MRKFKINVNGKSYEVDVEEVGGAATAVVAPIAAPSQTPTVESASTATQKAEVAPKPVQAAPAGATAVAAPMPGTIMSISVNVGDTVTKGQVLVVLEAMKMENEIMAPSNGKVVAINTTKGATVNTGDALVSLA